MIFHKVGTTKLYPNTLKYDTQRDQDISSQYDHLTDLVGFASRSEEREVLTGVDDPEQVRTNLLGRNYFGAEFRGESDGGFHVSLGLEMESKDRNAQSIRRRVGRQSEENKLPVEEFRLLLYLSHYLFDVVKPLPSKLEENEILSDLSVNPDLLSVLANAIIMASPDKWAYCVFLVKNNQDELKPVSYSIHSPEYLHDLRFQVSDQARGGSLLPGWICRHCEQLVVDPSDRQDRRITDDDLEFQTNALALTPAMLENEVQGVFILARKRSNLITLPFSREELCFLHIAAKIISESYWRARKAEIGTLIAQLRKAPLRTGPDYGESRSEVLKLKLSHVVNNELITSIRNNVTPEDLIVPLAIRLEGVVPTSERDWIIAQALGRIRELIKGQDKLIHPFPPEIDSVVIMPPEDTGLPITSVAIVALLGRYSGNVKALRTRIRDNLNAFASIGANLKLFESFVWSVDFTYAQLGQIFDIKGGLKGDTPAKVVEYLWKNILDALRVVTFIQKADSKMESGEYADASNLLKQACDLVPSNAYILRHLAECAIRRQDYRGAEQFARDAITEQDRVARSHQWLGIALTCLDRLDEAASEFEKALQYSGDLDLLAWFAKAMVLRADPEDRNRAYEQANRGLQQSPAARQSGFISLRADIEFLSQNYSDATEQYVRAIESSPKDDDLLWRFLMMRALATQIEKRCSSKP